MKRRLVIPGEEVAEGSIILGHGVYRDGEKIYSSILGLLDLNENRVRVIPMTGKYLPKVGDYVIGEIIGNPMPTAWKANIHSPYDALLNASDYYSEIEPFSILLSKIMPPGKMIYALIREITPTKRIYITLRAIGTHPLTGGRIINISPAKVPRVIGKKRSMINMIRKLTGCRVLVGQNGLVWIKGELKAENLVEKVIMTIESEAHTSGLTDRIEEMIEREIK